MNVAGLGLPRWPRGWWVEAAALGAAMLVVATGLALGIGARSPAMALGVPFALIAVVVLLRYPFAGLLAVVFGSQATAIIQRFLPTLGETALELVAALAIVGALISGYREPKSERLGPDILPVRVALLLFLSLLLSSVFAGDQELAWEGLRQRLNLLLLFWLILLLVKSPRQLRLLAYAIALSTVLSGGAALFTYATGIRILPAEEGLSEGPMRLAGATAQNATSASRMMLAGAALAALLAFRDRRWRWLGSAGALGGVAGIVLASSRSTFLVMLAGAGVLVRKVGRGRRFPQVAVLALLVAAVALVALPSALTERMSELREPSGDPTLERRWGYHLIGLDLLASHPLLGVGPNNYRRYYLGYEYRYMPGRYMEPRDLHDMYLSVAVETGVVGLVIFLAFLGTVLATVARARRRASDPETRSLAEAIQFALVLLLVASLFGAVQTNKFLWALLGMGAAAGRLADARDADEGAGPDGPVRGPVPDAP